MKLTPKKYAQALAQVISEKDADAKSVAKNFLDTLRRRRQTKLLPAILSQLERQWCEIQGITSIEVEYAPKFKDSLEVLQKALKSEKVLIHATPKEELIGGYRIKIDDTLIDASLIGQLTQLSNKLRT